MEKRKLCAFGKQIKLEIVDIEQNQECLSEKSPVSITYKYIIRTL